MWEAWRVFITHDYICSTGEMLKGLGILTTAFAVPAAVVGWILQGAVEPAEARCRQQWKLRLNSLDDAETLSVSRGCVPSERVFRRISSRIRAVTPRYLGVPESAAEGTDFGVRRRLARVSTPPSVRTKTTKHNSAAPRERVQLGLAIPNSRSRSLRDHLRERRTTKYIPNIEIPAWKRL